MRGRPGWAFAGGGNTPDAGISATFLIDLAPGDYQIAASYYPELAEGEEYDVANEIMQLSPLTVTEAAATPVAGNPSGAPDAGVTLEMTDDLRYIVTPDPVPAGPQVWEITNTGTEHSHHVVMYGVPDGTTADDIVADFASLMSGTPPAGRRKFVDSSEHGSLLRTAMVVVLGLLVALSIGREFSHLAHDGALGTSFGALVGLASGLWPT